MGIKSIMNVRFGTLSSKTSRVTNPFERNSFKGRAFTGNALPFADVFQSIKPNPKQNKLKMITGSVIGAISAFKTKISEPVAEFANNVKETYKKGVESIKTAKAAFGETGRSIKNRIVQVFEFNKISAENENGTKVLAAGKINNKASVEDLRTAWIAENVQAGEFGKAA